MPALPPRLLATTLATAAMMCSGCGESAPVAVGETPLRLTMSEYRIAPQAVRVPAGRARLVVRNGGTTVHRLQLRSEDRTRVLATSPPLRPGERTRLDVVLPPGTWVVGCAVERHDTLGEHGSIVAR